MGMELRGKVGLNALGWQSRSLFKLQTGKEIRFGSRPLIGTRHVIIWAAGVGAEQMRMRCPANERMTISVPAIDLGIQPMIGKTTSVTGVQFL